MCLCMSIQVCVCLCTLSEGLCGPVCVPASLCMFVCLCVWLSMQVYMCLCLLGGCLPWYPRKGPLLLDFQLVQTAFWEQECKLGLGTRPEGGQACPAVHGAENRKGVGDLGGFGNRIARGQGGVETSGDSSGTYTSHVPRVWRFHRPGTVFCKDQAGWDNEGLH